MPQLIDILDGVKTANMKYTCRVAEEVIGAEPFQPDPAIIDSNVPAYEDEGTGVLVSNSIP